MKHLSSKAIPFALLLIASCLIQTSVNAQTSVCDARGKFGIPAGTNGYNIFDLYCNSSPSDVTDFPGVNVTCLGCLAGGLTPVPQSKGRENGSPVRGTQIRKR